MLFDADFANNILLYFFLFFLFIDLNYLVPAVITKHFNPIAETLIAIGIPPKEAKTEMETLQQL